MGMGKGGTGGVSVAGPLMAAQHRLLAGSWGQPGGACSSGRACPSAARTNLWARGWMETGGLPRAAAGKGRAAVPGRSSRAAGSLAPRQNHGLLPAPSRGAREEETA